MDVFFYGFSLGLSLILAIGAQNAFVLRQGLRGEHVFIVCSICAFSDALLILMGVTGFRLVIERYPEIEMLARYLGAGFLFIYGLRSFWSAWGTRHALKPENESGTSLPGVVITTLALTWLNPHVYLDTVVLLGSVSTRFSEQIVWFTSGAMLASFVFFYSLGYGAARLRPLFSTAAAWQGLEIIIGLVMWAIAVKLLID